MLRNEPGDVWHFDANTVGRDYIVGDLHGCYDELMEMLSFLEFDKTKDRMFSVGDMIDRGPKSYECLKLLDEPWFYAVMGNHEDFMFNSLATDKPIWVVKDWVRDWRKNGGDWAYTTEFLAIANPREVAKKYLTNLPLIITVGSGEERFNVFHAELHDGSYPVSDETIDTWAFKTSYGYMRERLLWKRDIIKGAMMDWKSGDVQRGMSISYCGHTPLLRPLRRGAQVYIDTGAVFKKSDGWLTIADHKAKKLIKYHTTKGDVVEEYISNLKEK
jgi:serine/threonine protein phosphatase 1